MATWQESNGGSFLAGIGSQNSNAPQARDNLATLGLIQQNNEFTRQGGNNVGLQALQGLNGLASMHQQEQQKQQQQAFQSEYAAALQSGDREQIRALLSKYPQQVQAVQDGMKWSDDDYRNTLGNLATRGEVAAKSPDSFYSWIGNNADALKKVGADPNQLVTMYQQDPAGTARLIGSVGMHAMGHEKYWDLQDKMAGREIERGKLAEEVRNNDMTNARGIRGQNLSYQSSMNGHSLAAQRLSLDQQKFGFEIQQAQEKAELLKSGAPKLTDATSKMIDTSITSAAASQNSANTMNTLADQLLKDNPTAGIFGSMQNNLAKMSGSDTYIRDLKIRRSQLASSQAVKNLPPGPASDKDIQFAREGIPDDKDSPEVWARWLRGNAKMEQINADYNNFKAEWVSANGNPGQSRNDSNILGMNVARGESMNTAIRRYIGQQNINQPSDKPQAPQQQTGGGSYTSKSGIQFTVK